MSLIVARRDVDTLKVCELIRLCEDKGATIDLLVFERGFEYIQNASEQAEDESEEGIDIEI